MNNLSDYDTLKGVLHNLNTNDTPSSAHGILCGFACIKPELSLQNWLDEILIDTNLNNPSKNDAYQQLAKIYHNTLEQLGDAMLNFQLLIADENTTLKKQTHTLTQWCSGFLVGLGLCKIRIADKEILAMIKDFGEISKLDPDVVDNEQNARDLGEIIEFVRMGTLLIQETLQPSKQDYISPKTLH